MNDHQMTRLDKIRQQVFSAGGLITFALPLLLADAFLAVLAGSALLALLAGLALATDACALFLLHKASASPTEAQPQAAETPKINVINASPLPRKPYFEPDQVVLHMRDKTQGVVVRVRFVDTGTPEQTFRVTTQQGAEPEAIVDSGHHFLSSAEASMRSHYGRLTTPVQAT
jgi:hypothetical protein